MSSPLATIDLTGAVAGTAKTIDFSGFVKFNPAHLKEKAHLRVFNDSGCGLSYKMVASGSGDYIPAGGWATVELADNDSQMQITVLYILPNPPVSIVMPTYYAPGESVPPAPILGNSPVGVGGSVSTASNSLSNENSTLGTKIIDVGIVGNTDMLDIFNDHFLWKVIQSGVAHQVLAGNTAGNALQLGQAGDISEVLGKLLVDQGLAITVTSVVGTGSTSGTATFYEALSGTGLKIVLGLYNNYQNGGASTINIVLPTAFTFGALLQSSDIAGISLLASSVAQNIQVITTLAAGGGTVTTQTSFNKHSIAGILSAFDTIQLSATNNAAHTGVIAIIGI